MMTTSRLLSTSQTMMQRVIRCFKGAVEYGRCTMRPGDSRTRFWCKDSSLLGMGFGTLNNDAMIHTSDDRCSVVHPERMSRKQI